MPLIGKPIDCNPVNSGQTEDLEESDGLTYEDDHDESGLLDM